MNNPPKIEIVNVSKVKEKKNEEKEKNVSQCPKPVQNKPKINSNNDKEKKKTPDNSYTNIQSNIKNKTKVFEKKPKEKFFLCCSRISEEKGHMEVVEAFAEFYRRNREYRLVFAGFGSEDYINTLKRTIRKLGCEGAVDFIGYQDDVRSLMIRAKALIVASRFEAFGRMTAEAAFYGCPVIGKNTGGTKEILSIVGGIPYEGGAHELLNCMQRVHEMEDVVYQSIIENAQENAKKHFSIEANVDGVLNFYQDIMNRNKSSFSKEKISC